MAHPKTPLSRSLLAAVAAGALLATASLATPPAALAPAHHQAAASFDRFAQDWMTKMRVGEEESRRATRASFTGYGDGFEVELRPTGHPRAPYVGILRYEEREYRCSQTPAPHCGIARRVPVTEIFRFQDGRWVY